MRKEIPEVTGEQSVNPIDLKDIEDERLSAEILDWSARNVSPLGVQEQERKEKNPPSPLQ